MGKFGCCILLALNLLGCKEQQKIDLVTVSDQSIVIDGVKGSDEWAASKAITSFINPWNKEVEPATSLQLAKDSRYFYFYFEAEDEEIVLQSDFSNERDVEPEDRVELFFSKDKNMEEYYCFEIDPEGRTLAYSAKNYRQFDFDWDPPVGYKVVGGRKDGGYRVEGAIPLEFLKSLMDADGTVFLGAYRAEFSKTDDGKLVENWLTIVDPKTPSPDFHVPSSLGKLKIN